MEPKVYGYARVSTKKQNIERQVKSILNRYPNAEIYREVFTGRKVTGRKELEKILKKVRPGEKIVYDEASRMARNEEEGWELYEQLFNEGIILEFIQQPQLDTEVYRQKLESYKLITVSNGHDLTDKLINTIMSAVHEFCMGLAKEQIRLAFKHGEDELDFLSERTKGGLARAKAEGKELGLPKGYTYETAKAKAAKEVIRKHSKRFGGFLNVEECRKLAGTSVGDKPITRVSYFKYCAEIEDALTEDERVEIAEAINMRKKIEKIAKQRKEKAYHE